MVTVTCTRCGSTATYWGREDGAIQCPKCGTFKTPQPLTTARTAAMTTFLCKGCGVCVFTNALPDHRRCFACLKASPPVGTPVPAPKESAAPVAPTPHRCPVCEGKGEKPVGFYSRDQAAGGWVACKACKGAGLVWG